MVLTAAVSQSKREGQENETKEDSSAGVENNVSRYSGGENVSSSLDGSVLDEKKAEEMKELFATAESAMEAWAMLATSLGHPSFIKSEFEKICFLDNATTDTQVTFYVVGNKLTFGYNFLILEPLSFTAPHHLITRIIWFYH